MTRTWLVLLATSALGAATIELDSNRGQKVFESESCVQCHAIAGKGGHIAPDLGRVIDRNFTPAALASTMWNHAPTMWAAMEKQNVKRAGLDDQAAADLFAYFYSVRFFDKPGDAGRGKRLFHEKTCDTCHGLTNSPNPAAPPVSKWQSLDDPIELTQAMWNHSGSMYAEMQQKKMRWPQLSSQDLSDLLVYFRNLPGVSAKQSTLITTAGSQGEALFTSKGCKQCHDSGTLLFRTESVGRTLTDVAAALWITRPE
jgi:cytochrome c551/c552